MGTGCTGRKYVKNKVRELRRKLRAGANPIDPATLERLSRAVRKAQRDWQGRRRGGHC